MDIAHFDAEATQRLLVGQRAILAQLATGRPLREVLDGVARYAEESSPDLQASILFYEPAGGALRRGGHSRLAEGFADKVDGLVPGPRAGSCGTAAFHRRRIVSEDVQLDPLWEGFREFAAAYGIRSAWSTPLLSPETGALLGVFGMYYPTPRAPTPAELAVVDHFAHLATIAIEGKRRERALLESERLRQDAVTSLAIGIAHELNTPLGVARTTTAMLQEDLATGEGAVLSSLGLVRANIDRAIALVRAFRGAVFDRPEDPIEMVDVAALARRVVANVMPTLEARKIVPTVDGAPALAVRCSPLRLEQVLTNLVANAAQHAYDAGGPLSITVGPSIVRPDCAEIVVVDRGRGMSSEAAARCTAPFFTTARGSGNLGLGGFIARHVTESDLLGSLHLDSSPGVGTRWTVTLPTRLEVPT